MQLNMTVAKLMMALPAPRRDDVHLAPVPPRNPVNYVPFSPAFEEAWLMAVYAPLNVQVH